VLNSFQYQDKEDRKKVNTNEGEAFEDSVPELLGIYANDSTPAEGFVVHLITVDN
jgi:hypothetical protein